MSKKILKYILIIWTNS